MHTATLIRDITETLRNQRLARAHANRMRAVHNALCYALAIGLGAVFFLAGLLALLSDYSGSLLLDTLRMLLP
jgi:hypothetical protein